MNLQDFILQLATVEFKSREVKELQNTVNQILSLKQKQNEKMEELNKLNLLLDEKAINHATTIELQEQDQRLTELKSQLAELVDDDDIIPETSPHLSRLAALESNSPKIRSEIKLEMSKKERMDDPEISNLIIIKAENLKLEKQQYKKTHILSVGAGYSSDLNDDYTVTDFLKRYNLPLISDELVFCDMVNLELNRLKWLITHKKASTISHYTHFHVFKKNGDKRLIWAPKRDLRRLQKWILENILEKFPLHSSAKGFVKNESIISNATAHQKKKIVLNLDLKDFFHTFDFRRVLGLFKSMGYSGKVSTILAMLTTESDRKRISIHDQLYFVEKGVRKLPQGAPSSPMITNLICWKLDNRLTGLAKKFGWDYSRYADDLTFSGDDVSQVKHIYHLTRKIIEDENLVINNNKIKFLRPSNRQMVTGIIVNDKISFPREWRRKLRAELHTLAKYVDNGNFQEATKYSLNSLKGKIALIKMINLNSAFVLKQKLDSIIEKIPLEMLTQFG